MDYEKQADSFLKKSETTFIIAYSHTGLCDITGKKRKHHIFEVILSNVHHTYTLEFTDSFRNTERRNYAQSINTLYVDDVHTPTRLGFTVKNKNLNRIEVLDARKPPTAYSILACLTKYPPRSFSEFCEEYGYDTDSQKGLKTWESVIEEYTNVYKLFSFFMDDLREIS